jgi:hypothetical protein
MEQERQINAEMQKSTTFTGVKPRQLIPARVCGKRMGIILLQLSPNGSRAPKRFLFLRILLLSPLFWGSKAVVGLWKLGKILNTYMTWAADSSYSCYKRIECQNMGWARVHEQNR